MDSIKNKQLVTTYNHKWYHIVKISFIFASQSTLLLLNKTAFPEGSYKIGFAHSSLLPSVLLSAFPSFHLFGCFFESVWLIFSKFWHVVESHRKLCVQNRIFPLFCPQNWENGPKLGLKTGSFEFIGKFGH